MKKPAALKVPPRHPTPNYRHGAFTTRRYPLTDEEKQEVDDLLALAHVLPADRAAAEEVVRLRSMVSRIDMILHSQRRPNSHLLAVRATLSGKLLSYLESFGLTPKSRAEWVARLAAGSLQERLAKRLEEIHGKGS
jgi:hypothetical protein